MARYEQGRGPFFVQVPFELLQDERIDGIAVSVYCAIKMHADFGKAVGSRVSDRTGARLAKCSERTFRDRRALLATFGWIEWEQVPGKPNRYLVHNSPAEPAVENPDPRQDVPGSDVHSEPHPGTTCRPPRQEMPTPPEWEKSPVNPASGAASAGKISGGTPAGDADDRYNREPIPRNTPSGAAAPAGEGGAAEDRRSWSAKAIDTWTARMQGRAPSGRIGKALKPLVVDYGASAVLEHWDSYLAAMIEQGRGGFATPEDFAGRYGMHVAAGGALSAGGGQGRGSRPTQRRHDYGQGSQERQGWKR